MTTVTEKPKKEALKSLIEEEHPESKVYLQEEIYLNKNVEIQIRLEELKTLQEQNRTLSQNNDERKKYAKCIFVFTIIWAASIFVILFLTGKKWLFISDKIIIVLISSTTINFFGFFLLVIKYLFNSNHGVADKKWSFR